MNQSKGEKLLLADSIKTFSYHDMSFLNLFSEFCQPESCCGFNYWKSLTTTSYVFYKDIPLPVSLFSCREIALYYIQQYGYNVNTSNGSVDFCRIQLNGNTVAVPPYLFISPPHHVSCVFVIARDDTVLGGDMSFRGIHTVPYWLKYYPNQTSSFTIKPLDNMGIIYPSELYETIEPFTGTGYVYMIRISFQRT